MLHDKNTTMLPNYLLTLALTAPAPVGANPVGANPVGADPVGTNPVTQPITGGSGVGGAFSGKRGVAYNDASLTQPFAASSLFGWGHNWVSSSDGLGQSFSYIPTLHNGDSQFTANWANEAQAAISSGSKYLFGFNEPGKYRFSPQSCHDD